MPDYSPELPRRALIAILALAAALYSTVVAAESLLFPDDISLRSDIQLLSDAGLLSAPVSGWPLSVSALREEMLSVPVPLQYQTHIREAWHRVMTRLGAAPRFKLRLAAIDEPIAIRRFGDTPRGSGLRGIYQIESDTVSLRLSATLEDSPNGERETRADGSFAGFVVGAWQLSIGQVPRWWGPGYESSLILSSNARPVPALSLDTVTPIRFESKWLSWLGAMDWRIFAGKLEGSRFVSDARLLGARLSLRPTRKLEIGLSRTAQWGGAGRPQDFSSFLNLLLGRDNRGDAGITLADEPGNQLAGADLRWLSPIGDAPYAVYLQMIGEDEAGGLPSRLIGMAGGEMWREFFGGSLRVYAEFANTAVGFYKSMSLSNLAYEHYIYRSGYRYRGRSLGHAMDSDGLMLSLGAIWNRDGHGWEAVLRRIDVNKDGVAARGFHPISVTGEDRWELWLASRMSVLQGQLSWGLLAEYINPASAATVIEPTAYASWERAWGASER